MTSFPTLSRASLIACVVLFTAPAWTQTGPLLLNLNPSSVTAGNAGFVLTVNGSNFLPGARILWNGTPLATVFGSSTQLTAPVPASLLTAPGAVFVNVSNPDGRTSPTFLFTITAPQLSIVTSALPQATVGIAYSTALQATGGSPPYSWAVQETLPAGLTMATNGTLSGTPQASGTFNLTFRVSDAQQQIATRPLSLVVSPPPFSILTNSPLPSGTVGTPYTQTFTVAGGVPPYRWSAAGTLPTGLTLDANGTLRGTPQARGSFTFTVQVSDSGTFTTSKPFTLTINPAALSITTESPLFQGTVGTFYTQTFFASGGVTPYTWSIASGQIPPGLSFDASAASLSGTPTQSGSFTFVLRVADSAGQQATKVFTVTVELPRLTIITGPQLPAGQEGAAYSQRLTATGGSAPYTWTIVTGQVAGLSLDPSSGTLAGTPTQSGSFALTIQVADAFATTASRVFNLTINPRPLVITSAAQLPGGSINEPYLFAFAAAGGAPPYTWSANGVPDGLVLDSNTGELSGAPKAAGSILITVRVTDAARNSATELFRLTISLPPLPEFQLGGLPDTGASATQPSLDLRLSTSYPIDISGQLTLTFTPEAGAGDATIQFSTGGRVADFKFPANSQRAVYAAPGGADVADLAIQTGTVAGVITVTARLQSGGVDITPSTPPSRSVRIARAAPVIRSAVLVRTSAGLEVRITGYSSPREVTRAVFRFRSNNPLAQPEVTVTVEPLFSRWYQDAASTRFGSLFLFTQAFTVQGGDASLVTPESVTLENRTGSTSSPIN
jgi:hypothetical protein